MIGNRLKSDDGFSPGAAHEGALRVFARRLSWMLAMRRAAQWTAVWFFLWGAVVLGARISGVSNQVWLLAGLAGFLPLALLAAGWEARRRPAPARLRAAYDAYNQCGGLVMAAGETDMTAWDKSFPQASVPSLRWRSRRAMSVLLLSAVFVAVTLQLPDRWTRLATRRQLEVGNLVAELQTEVKVLKEEKILEPKKADGTQQQLAKLKEQSSAVDPAKTWEALDHIKEANNDLSKEAAGEVAAKQSALTQAEVMAGALQSAMDQGLDKDTATQAAQDLAGMLAASKLEEGVLNGQIPPELLSQLKGTNLSNLSSLLGAIQANKSQLSNTLIKLANLHMIDPKTLSQCQNAGQCPNPNSLAQYLSQCTNGSCSSFLSLAESLCLGRGGPGGGGPPAPVTWQDTSEDNAKFKEEAINSNIRPADSQFTGVSRAAPELSAADVVAGHGALASAQGNGGSANAQVILPRHKQAVQRFFKRGD